MARGTNLLKIALAWLPFCVLWILFMMSYAEGSLGYAVASGVTMIGGAAVLGLGVWWFTGRINWPERLKLSFYAVHLVAGAMYGLAWAALEATFHAVNEGISAITWILESDVFGWIVLMGVFLYGLIAGVSYTVRMRQSLREQERVAARAEALAVKAQLQTLRAQLNPHFLFNALHSFSTLIRHDPQAAERAVERLGDLLRYALDEGQDEVPLGDEWTFTRHYLDLERLRLDARLKIDTNFEPEALECLVPSFTLQPLVENAIQHSIAPRPEGGTVVIGAKLRDGELVVEVRDDGPGAADEGSDNRGLGLSILRQRLQALYGDAAALSIDTAPGHGFSATVSLPRRTDYRPRKGASS